MEIPVFPVLPSGTFDGDDGQWSTFNLRVGSNAQGFRVLPSTQIGYTMIVDNAACTAAGLANCSNLRGGTFQQSQTSTWSKLNGTTTSVFSLGLEIPLGFDQSKNTATFGLDTVGAYGVGSAGGVILDDRVVATITTQDFYLGLLGVGIEPSDFQNGTTYPSFLEVAKQEGKIPSLSFGYTAGRAWNKQAGSLTLGGYDAARLEENEVAFSFSPSTANSLIVGVQQINILTNGDTSSLIQQNSGISVLIDSTIPELWLPQDICDQFATAFNLTYSSLMSLYTIDDTSRTNNLASNATVSLVLGNSASGGNTITIDLPYEAFDKQYVAPKVLRDTYVFPIRRAASQSQYRLGRTFLQEAYLSVDYENTTFNVSQATTTFDDPDYVTIGGPTAASPSGSAPPSGTTSPGSSAVPTNVTIIPNGSSSGLSTGAIAGIAVGIALVALGALIFLFCCIRRRRRNRVASPHGHVAELPDNKHESTTSSGFSFFNKFSRQGSVKHSHNPSMSKTMPMVYDHELDGHALSSSPPPVKETASSGYFTPRTQPVELPVDVDVAELQSPQARSPRSVSPSLSPETASLTGAWGTGGTNYEERSPHNSISTVGAVPPDLNRRVSDRSTSRGPHSTGHAEMSAFTSPVVPFTRYRDHPSPRPLSPASASPSPEVERGAFLDSITPPAVDERH